MTAFVSVDRYGASYISHMSHLTGARVYTWSSVAFWLSHVYGANGMKVHV